MHIYHKNFSLTDYIELQENTKLFENKLKKFSGAIIAFGAPTITIFLSAIMALVFSKPVLVMMFFPALIISMPFGMWWDIGFKNNIRKNIKWIPFIKNPYPFLDRTKEHLLYFLKDEQFQFEFLYNLNHFKDNLMADSLDQNQLRIAKNTLTLHEKNIKEAFIKEDYHVALQEIIKLNEEYLKIDSLYSNHTKIKNFETKFNRFIQEKEGIEAEIEHTDFQEKLRKMM